jgi:translation initiation factor IF-2
MSDTDNKPTLGRKPLGLKHSVEAGEVKQTFSHGRTNKVVVEVKRRKVLGGRPDGGTRRHGEPRHCPAGRRCRATPAPAPAAAAPAPAPAAPRPAAPALAGPAPGARARPSGSASHSRQ